jgi:hypothetical protein
VTTVQYIQTLSPQISQKQIFKKMGRRNARNEIQPYVVHAFGVPLLDLGDRRNGRFSTSGTRRLPAGLGDLVLERCRRLWTMGGIMFVAGLADELRRD